MSNQFIGRTFQHIGRRLYEWYDRSLVNRMSLKAQILMAGLLIVIGFFSYALAEKQLERSSNDRLNALALLYSQRLQSEIDKVLIQAEGLSKRSLVLNALTDSAERNAYLSLFLAEYRLGFPDMNSISLLDQVGVVIAASSHLSWANEAIFSRAMSSGKAALVMERRLGRSILVLAYPVISDASGMPEGALVGEVDLSALARRTISSAQAIGMWEHHLSVIDESGQTIFASAESAPGETLVIRQPLGGELASSGQHLALSIAVSKSAVYEPLQRMILLILGGSVAALLAIMYLVRRLANSIVQPLAEMSHHAMEIAGAGPSGLQALPVNRRDEIGWMGMAFNEMVFSLRQAYNTQDEQVRARTAELAVAQERLSGVLAGLDDVVYATDPKFKTFEYLSPAAAKVFGQPAEVFIANPLLYRAMILPEDVTRLAETRRAQGLGTEQRYRIRRPDGSIRWMLDRFWLIRDEAGNPVRINGLVRDITQSVEAEASIHLQERALASSSCGVVIADMRQAGQPVLYVNDAFERITGYSADEVLGKNCSILQGAEMAQDRAALDEIRLAIREGRSTKVVLTNYRKTGEAFWNELQLSPLHDETGRVTHYIGIQNDISASVAATQALMASEQRLALTIDALHEGVWDWNIPNDVLITSPSWYGILGFDPAGTQGEMNFSGFLDRIPDHWKEQFRGEINDYMVQSENDFYLEHQMMHADGRLIWVANHGRVVERQSDGTPLRMVGTIVDITLRIDASQRINRLMHQLDMIISLSPDAFVYFGEQGDLVFVNPAFERMIGINGGELAGMSLEQFRQRLAAWADPDYPFPKAEEVGLDTDWSGRLLHMLKPVRRVLLVSRRGGSDGRSAVVYLRDVTRETEVDRMKSEFLSTAAHELRTPMASIMGFAELLMIREFAPERMRDMLETMHRQARRLTDLVNELLDLARIEARAGKDFKIANHRLGQVIEDAVAALHVDGDRGRMRLNLPEQLPEIPIDSAKMEQAVINLLSNAYKYSPDGGAIDISVSFRTVSAKEQIGIVVRDHGIGMSPEQCKRVFERFFRADPSGNIPGTGLGMSLVKEIMDSHGGTVDVASELGDGTQVTLWLPLSPAAEGATGQPVEPEANRSQSGELTLWLNEPDSNPVSHQLH